MQTIIITELPGARNEEMSGPAPPPPHTHTHCWTHSACRRFASTATCWWCSRSRRAAKRMEKQSPWWLLLGTSCFAKLYHWSDHHCKKEGGRERERSSENGNEKQETTALPCDGMYRWGEASDSLRLRYAAPTRLTVRRASFYDDTQGQVESIRKPVGARSNWSR